MKMWNCTISYALKETLLWCVMGVMVMTVPLLPAQDVISIESTSDFDMLSVISASELVEQSNSKLDFYQGINLLNTGHIPESLIAFQRAIAKDNTPLYQYMFARANESYGLVNNAFDIFQALLAVEFEPTLLRSKIEIQRLENRQIGNRNQALDYFQKFSQLIRANTIDTQQWGGYILPMSLRVLPNGNIAVVFLQSQEIIIISPTGNHLFTLNLGILEGFGGMYPTDIIYTLDDTFLVASFQQDDILQFTEEGRSSGSFITVEADKKEDFDNSFIGPQFLSEDSEGSIYATTYGSAQIFKFSSDGEYLFRFGEKTLNFNGLQSPTGLEVLNDTIYVADVLSEGQAILYTFDVNGNFLFTLPIEAGSIESLRKINNEQLLVSSDRGLIKYNVNTKSIIEILNLADFGRITSAEFDKNNILWVIDQERGRLEAYSYLVGQYSGLNIHITSIDTTQFPEVMVDLSVSDSFNTPIVGLSANNILLFEHGVSINEVNIVEQKDFNQDQESIVIIPSNISLGEPQQRKRVIETINAITNEGQAVTLEDNDYTVNFWMMEVGQVPQYVISNNVWALDIQDKIKDIDFSDPSITSLLISIRSALNTLLTTQGRKTIMFIGNPHNVGDNASIKILWDQISNILQFHHISFAWVDTTDTDNEILAENFQHFLTQAEGITLHYLINDIISSLLKEEKKEGLYQMVFRSDSTTKFFNKFVPLELEVQYFTRSGKDFSGFMLPRWGE